MTISMTLEVFGSMDVTIIKLSAILLGICLFLSAGFNLAYKLNLPNKKVGIAMKRKYSQEEISQHMTGRIYFNKNDLNIFVRRKSISSWTMNLGNKWSWIIMLVEFAVIAIVLFLLI